MDHVDIIYTVAQYAGVFAGLMFVCYGMARFLVYATDHERSRRIKEERRDHDFFDGR